MGRATPTAIRVNPQQPSLWASIGAHLRTPPALASCGRIALIVGTILTAINQLDTFVGGHYSSWIWLKVVMNCVVPFCVSSAGYITASRRAPRLPGGDE